MIGPASGALKSPLILGIVPLSAGLSIFLLWLVTDWRWLPIIGLATLYLGFGSVVAGLGWLGIWIWKRGYSGNWPKGPLLGQVIFVAAVLLINFPVAGGIVWTASFLMTRYTVTIGNHSTAAIQSAALSGGGVSLEFGSIPPGARITKGFQIVHDSTLVFSGEQNGRKLEATVDSYVTHGAGGHKEIDVSTGGSIEVQDRNR